MLLFLISPSCSGSVPDRLPSHICSPSGRCRVHTNRGLSSKQQDYSPRPLASTSRPVHPLSLSRVIPPSLLIITQSSLVDPWNWNPRSKIFIIKKQKLPQGLYLTGPYPKTDMRLSLKEAFVGDCVNKYGN